MRVMLIRSCPQRRWQGRAARAAAKPASANWPGFLNIREAEVGARSTRSPDD